MIKRLFLVLMAIAIIGLASCQKSEDKSSTDTAEAPKAQAQADKLIKLDDSIPFEQNIPVFPMKGNPNALVTVLAYMDYHCPHCISVDATIMKVLEDNPGNVRIAVLPMPNESDPISMSTAKALIAAHVLGKFWELHDALMKNSAPLTDTFIKYQMTTLGMDEAEYTKIMENEETAEFIKKVIASAKARGLNGTPSILINGDLLVGNQPPFVFQVNIERAIKVAGEVASSKNLSGEALFQELSKANANKKYAPFILDAQPDAPFLGDPNAIITIEVFSDFSCDHCVKVESIIKELLTIYNGKLKFIYRHSPYLSNEAPKAHYAAEAARLQGKFWEYAEKLYADQANHNRDNFIQIATSLGLDVAKFTADMDSEEVIKRVNTDLKTSFNFRVRGLPCFRMNGTLVYGARPIDDFKYFIDKELKRAQLYIDRGLKGKDLYRMLVKNPIDQTLLASSPFKGNPDAPITVIEFSDFQCPACADASRSINRLLSDPEFSGKFKVYYKHRLAEGHKNAQKAAEASVYAQHFGKFWELHDLLFVNQDKLDTKSLKSYAAKIGLNAADLDAALRQNFFKDTVKADDQMAADLSINTIPALVINGRIYKHTETEPLTYEQLKKIFSESMGLVRLESESNVCPCSSN